MLLPPSTISSIAATAITQTSPHLAKALHAHILKTHTPPLPPTLSNHLVNIYSKLGLINYATLVLSLTPYPDVVTFTSFISGAAQNGYIHNALTTFSLMRRCGVSPNDFTYPSVFKAAASLGSEKIAKLLHGSDLKDGNIGNVSVGCEKDAKLIHGLSSKNGNIDSVYVGCEKVGKLRDGLSLKDGNIDSVYVGCEKDGKLKRGLALKDGNIDSVYVGSSGFDCGDIGKMLHGLAVKEGWIGNVYVGSSAFDMYCKMGMVGDAEKVFDEMPERNLTTWNAYMTNAVLNGFPENAICGFVELRRSGIGEGIDRITLCAFLNACSDGSYLDLGKMLHGFVVKYGCEGDVSVCNGLIDFYGKCRDIRSSELVFVRMGYLNDVSWSSMVAAYEGNDEQEKACSVFLEARQRDVEITDFMVSSVLSACAGIAGLELGRCVHTIAIKVCFESNLYVGSALVDMYGKCGSLEDCERAFHEMPERNLVTWNALLGGHAHQGHADVALELFQRITRGVDGVVPNYVTLVCILSACSRAGKVREGMEIFESMRETYKIRPGIEHYACVVDMLSRAGKVEQAYEFIQKLPIHPNVSIWGALLGGCRVYGKPELGKIAAEKLFELDPQDSGNHVLLSNMFAAAGRWEEANLVRKEMVEVGIKKDAGCSWVSLKDGIHVFQAKDTSHIRNLEIQAVLAELKIKMKAAGYRPDTKFALYDLEEEERETEVWHHSEKIALAFGLIVVPPGVPIRITKNLRVCVDCHSAIKFISGIVGREIIVRDNNRFHRFKDNQCSCNDYW